MRVFNVESKTMVCEFRAHSQDVNCVSFCPADGNVLASASDDGFIKLWSVQSIR